MAPLLYINLRKSCDPQAVELPELRSLSAPVWAVVSLPQERRDSEVSAKYLHVRGIVMLSDADRNTLGSMSKHLIVMLTLVWTPP